MPKIAPAHRSANALPASLPAGAAPRVRQAATAALHRLRVWPPVDSMNLATLRDYVRHVHGEHVARGGNAPLPSENYLRALTRAELEDIVRELRGVRCITDPDPAPAKRAKGRL